MAEVQIRRYKDDDEVDVKDIFTVGMHELIPYSCKYVLKQPHVQMLLLSVFCVLLATSGSLLLPMLAVTLLLAAGWQGICYMIYNYVRTSMCSDFSNIRQSYLEKPNSCFWVAESQGRVVGTVACYSAKEDKDCVELRRMSVKPSHRGQGIAKALCHIVADFARDQGCPAVVLYTSSVQIDAQKLYERMGYKKVREFASPVLFSRITKIMVMKYVLDLQQPGN
ncbi:probable N-acetyltransferase camello isoform X2 [Colossoma macropomum]|nr:probable N-acetyltransferase camello isoform X2 [Colossoma macropomum]XP_036429760.1 probable N-acetyltransferase camello isoform X2 [Colossoma macropomum]XP_036429761.1 probable N-acetyltransferase camello isoform X2 [Colossoma macropomum]XP_036429762.1 probable N-acetyltransferase camello isoform X2 [Colossoma macropomum]XP_036429763.1 probable N-acetyltransferase camello isoform X2 [Colossoma macropomum]